MKKYTRDRVRRRKRRIDYRLRDRTWKPQPKPMLSASNIQYEMGERQRGTAVGGIGMMHLLARRTGLIESIDRKVEVLKRHLPYHESDQVLNIAYNMVSGGTCLEDIEVRRQDEVYLDALGAQRIPDPTTAGDFCRRFETEDIEHLMASINETRLKVWSQQTEEFFEMAIVDADGTLTETGGECKKGMDVAYNGVWGYHSLANTQEPLFLVNRPGNRPSHEGAAARLDQAVELCAKAGFRRMLLRGDTDFSQTRYLDGWSAQGVEFIFGIDAMPNLVSLAEALAVRDWKQLKRPAKYEVATTERTQQALFDDIRYFFYITNCMEEEAVEIVLLANDRCNQENLIAQLKNGVQAMRMPVDDQNSNWVYMVMASLAWTLKAWFALLLPEAGRWGEKYANDKHAVLRMEFKTFLNAFIRLPFQVIRTGGQISFV